MFFALKTQLSALRAELAGLLMPALRQELDSRLRRRRGDMHELVGTLQCVSLERQAEFRRDHGCSPAEKVRALTFGSPGWGDYKRERYGMEMEAHKIRRGSDLNHHERLHRWHGGELLDLLEGDSDIEAVMGHDTLAHAIMRSSALRSYCIRFPVKAQCAAPNWMVTQGVYNTTPLTALFFGINTAEDARESGMLLARVTHRMTAQAHDQFMTNYGFGLRVWWELALSNLKDTQVDQAEALSQGYRYERLELQLSLAENLRRKHAEDYQEGHAAWLIGGGQEGAGEADVQHVMRHLPDRQYALLLAALHKNEAFCRWLTEVAGCNPFELVVLEGGEITNAFVLANLSADGEWQEVEGGLNRHWVAKITREDYEAFLRYFLIHPQRWVEFVQSLSVTSMEGSGYNPPEEVSSGVAGMLEGDSNGGSPRSTDSWLRAVPFGAG